MIRKIKYQALFIIYLLLYYNSSAQLKTLYSGERDNLNSISLSSGRTGWIVGDKGALFYLSHDSLIKYHPITDQNLNSVCIIDGKGWAVGSKGTILYYDGLTWMKISSPVKEDLLAVSFRSSTHGFAVGTHGALMIYENGGWKSVRTDLTGNLYSVSDKNDLTLIGGGFEYFNIPLMKIEGTIVPKLTKIFDPGYLLIKSIAVIDKNNIWSAGVAGTIYHYSQGRWEKDKQTALLPTLNSISFSDENCGIAAGYGGTILTFSDRGWLKEESPVNVKLNGTAISGNTFYAVGDMGTIVTFSHLSSNIALPTNQIQNLEKVICYPNPSSETINMIIPEVEGFFADYILLTNINGQTILKKDLESLSGGQIYNLSTSGLKSGFYFINIISTGGKKATGRFVVTH